MNGLFIKFIRESINQFTENVYRQKQIKIGWFYVR